MIELSTLKALDILDYSSSCVESVVQGCLEHRCSLTSALTSDMDEQRWTGKFAQSSFKCLVFNLIQFDVPIQYMRVAALLRAGHHSQGPIHRR